MNKSLVPLTVILYSLFLASDGINYHQLNQEGKVQANDPHIAKAVFETSRLRRQAPINVTQDHHLYYTSRYIPPGEEAGSLWFELSDLAGSGGTLNDVTEAIIQEFFRYYQVWRLKFNFPFYGHILNAVAVTTGGFLYTGTFLHEQIHLTQFIAPLQANFNPSLNDTAKIYVYSTESRFTVQWDEVHNHDHINDGPFSFQVSVFPNGTIYFVYREIPLTIDKIDNDNHPVVVGLADSFYIDYQAGPFIIRSIFEYSRIILNATQDLSDSAYILTPIKNCVIATSCEECTNITQEGNFDCTWCPALTSCSDGLDRNRQSWLAADCNANGITCPSPTTTTTTISPTITLRLSVGASVGISLFVIVIVLVLVAGATVVLLLIYSYKRPSSRFGRILQHHHKGETAKYEIDGGVAIMDDTDDVEQTDSTGTSL